MEENTLEIVQAAATTAVGRRASNAVILDLRELDCFTDFFVVCSGTSDIQVEGISESVLDELKEKWGVRPWHREGQRKADWVLLDYVDFVVHIFLEDRREYYDIERLWAEAPQIKVPDIEPIGYEDDEEYDELSDYDFDERVFDDDFDTEDDEIVVIPDMEGEQ